MTHILSLSLLLVPFTEPGSLAPPTPAPIAAPAIPVIPVSGADAAGIANNGDKVIHLSLSLSLRLSPPLLMIFRE